MRQFSNMIPLPRLVDTAPAAGAPGADHFGPVLLVTVRGPMDPPFCLGDHLMHRMRLVLADPGSAFQFHPHDVVVDRIPDWMRVPRFPPGDPRTCRPRPIQGEIVRDSQGRLYEMVGQAVRPLRKLVSAAGGHLLEVERPPEPPVIDVQPEETPPAPASARPGPPAIRRLFPEPGQWRVVALGDFKPMLTPQLAHPERLRDEHRLPCHVQVFEATSTGGLDQLAASLLGDPKRASQLQKLTPEIAAALDLESILPPRRARPHRVPAPVRFFRLQLAVDPTADARPPSAPAPRAPDRPAPSKPESKTAIPEAFTKPWEFRFSRDEVLYDLHARSSWLEHLAALFRALFGARRREFRRWRALLHGKSADEQLWGVRPPKGAFTVPPVREWAHATLAAGGYDPAAMLIEWEIFWRRKGL